jgi:hypothetical protein
MGKNPAESEACHTDSILAAFSIEDEELSLQRAYRIDGKSYNFFNGLLYLG